MIEFLSLSLIQNVANKIYQSDYFYESYKLWVFCVSVKNHINEAFRDHKLLTVT